MKNLNDNIFISYAKEDFNQYVIPVISVLEKYYINYWLDTDQINVGDKLFKKLEEKILKIDKFIVFISNTYVNKQWCMHELEMMVTNNKIIIPVICGEESIRNIRNFPFVNNYAFEELISTFSSDDIHKIIHRIIKTIISEIEITSYYDYKVIIEQIQRKSIYNKEIIIYFICLLANNTNSLRKESIIIINNITDLIISDIMRKHNYNGNKSIFISKERFPQEILLSLAIIQNSKTLIMENNNLCRLLFNNCVYAFRILLEWYLS